MPSRLHRPAITSPACASARPAGPRQCLPWQRSRANPKSLNSVVVVDELLITARTLLPALRRLLIFCTARQGALRPPTQRVLSLSRKVITDSLPTTGLTASASSSVHIRATPVALVHGSSMHITPAPEPNEFAAIANATFAISETESPRLASLASVELLTVDREEGCCPISFCSKHRLSSHHPLPSLGAPGWVSPWDTIIARGKFTFRIVIAKVNGALGPENTSVKSRRKSVICFLAGSSF